MAESKYFHTFGLFIDSFANLEATLAWFLRDIAGVDAETGRAIFSGTRVETAVSHIKRIFEARGQQMPPRLLGALSQISVINGMRNDLVHHPLITSETKGMHYSTKLVAHIPERIRETPISTRILRSAIADMNQIYATLLWYWATKDATPDFRKHVQKVLGRQVRHAWRYIPPSQATNRPKTHGNQPRPQRLPKPSPASP